MRLRSPRWASPSVLHTSARYASTGAGKRKSTGHAGEALPGRLRRARIGVVAGLPAERPPRTRQPAVVAFESGLLHGSSTLHADSVRAPWRCAYLAHGVFIGRDSAAP